MAFLACDSGRAKAQQRPHQMIVGLRAQREVYFREVSRSLGANAAPFSLLAATGRELAGRRKCRQDPARPADQVARPAL